MNNKVFYQHPNLMRVLGMHETVMEVMVNVLGAEKSQVMPELDPWAGTQEATCLQPRGWSPLIQLFFPGCTQCQEGAHSWMMLLSGLQPERELQPQKLEHFSHCSTVSAALCAAPPPPS